MVSYCKEQIPVEACGILSGKGKHIFNIYPLENIENSRYAFAIGEQDFYKTLKLIHEKEEEFNGVFHSHPTSSPYPSYNDIKHAYSPNVVYIIISYMYNVPRMRAYYIVSEKVKPVYVQRV